MDTNHNIQTRHKPVAHAALLGIIYMLLGACGSSVPDSPPPDTGDTQQDETVIDTTTVTGGLEVETAALVTLGDKLYRDTDLSVPAGQACASCHDPLTGFDDPDSGDPTSLGANGSSIGTRNSPTASYAAHIPTRQVVNRPPVLGGPAEAILIGGQFLDGRAATLEEQAKQPFLNPVEMANADKAAVIASVKLADYAADFEALFGAGTLDDTELAYDYVADAIAAFERTDLFSPFSSKFDRELAGNASYTVAEANGRALFNGKGQCNLCHRRVGGTGPDIFSNFEYFNIGVPANASLDTALGTPADDHGLGGDTGQAADDGKFRVPTLRNVANTAPYMHNGVFSTLKDVVEFYNTRDITPITPEVSDNVFQPGTAIPDMGNLGLSAAEVDDIVAFLEALSDQ